MFSVHCHRRIVPILLCDNAEDHKHEFPPDVANTILRNFYVDDCLKSLLSTSAAIKHVADLCKLMLIGGFND